MVSIDDLTGIPKDKRKEIVRCLDDLLSYRTEQGKLLPVITGFNFYNRPSSCERMITFSHIHESKEYKQDMLNDLKTIGYDRNYVIRHVRNKGSRFLWNPAYNFRKKGGKIFPRLKIKDLRDNTYIDLEIYENNLIDHPNFRKSRGYLIAENCGWELNLPFNNKKELLELTSLFLSMSQVSSKHNIISWRDAYKVPVIILGNDALKYVIDLKGFDKVIRFYFIENQNEINFIIDQKLKILKNLNHYDALMKIGFREEICLANKAFIEDINKTR